MEKQKEQGLKVSSCELVHAHVDSVTNSRKSLSCYKELKNIEVLNAFKESVVEDAKQMW